MADLKNEARQAKNFDAVTRHEGEKGLGLTTYSNLKSSRQFFHSAIIPLEIPSVLIALKPEGWLMARR